MLKAAAHLEGKTRELREPLYRRVGLLPDTTALNQHAVTALTTGRGTRQVRRCAGADSGLLARKADSPPHACRR